MEPHPSLEFYVIALIPPPGDEYILYQLEISILELQDINCEIMHLYQGRSKYLPRRHECLAHVFIHDLRNCGFIYLRVLCIYRAIPIGYYQSIQMMVLHQSDDYFKQHSLYPVVAIRGRSLSSIRVALRRMTSRRSPNIYLDTLRPKIYPQQPPLVDLILRLFALFDDCLNTAVVAPNELKRACRKGNKIVLSSGNSGTAIVIDVGIACRSLLCD